jgi:hypothetical protein
MKLLTSSFLSFPAKKYKKVTGKEIYSDTLESTPMLEKEKFPQDYFPEVRRICCLSHWSEQVRSEVQMCSAVGSHSLGLLCSRALCFRGFKPRAG